MHRSSFTLAACALGLSLTGLAAAGEDAVTLTVGDAAPDIDIAHWIKGVEVTREGFTPMTTFEEGKVYVLEFWATWCGPCKAGMPHLSKLQEKYEDYDVTIIGVSDEPLATVVPFLFKTDPRDGQLQNDRTKYVLTTDPDESVKNDYFRAAGRRGIPSAFIIGKDRKIEWIGHPIDMDAALEGVVFDTWDRDAFKAEMLRAEAAERKYREAYKTKDWTTVIEILDDRIEADPENLGARLQKFNILLMEVKDTSRAYGFGEQLVEMAWDESGLLNAIAWTVADDKRVGKRDLEFALKAAERANELTDSAEAAVLDTLARVWFEKGELREAIRWQQKAADVAGEGAMGDSIREALERYKKAAGR